MAFCGGPRGGGGGGGGVSHSISGEGTAGKYRTLSNRWISRQLRTVLISRTGVCLRCVSIDDFLRHLGRGVSRGQVLDSQLRTYFP